MLAQQLKTDGSVVEFRSQAAAKFYIPASQAVNNFWAEILPRPVTSVLSFIIERTLRWGKVKESIPYRHFIEGVYSKDGAVVQPRARIARRNLSKAVAILEGLGFIKVVRATTTQRGFESNLFEIDFNLIIQRDTSMLKTPKRLKNKADPLVSLGHKPCVPRTLPLCPGDTLNTLNIKSQKVKSQNNPDAKKPASGLAGARSVKELVDAVAKRSVEKREARVRAFKLHPDNVRAVWQKAMQDRYGSVPAVHFTKKSYGTFKKLVNLHFKNTQQLPDFLFWVVGSWTALRAGKLAWMNKKGVVLGEAPDLAVVSKFLRTFAAAYADHLAGDVLNEEKKVATGRRVQKPDALEKTLKHQQQRIRQLEIQNARLAQSGPVPAPDNVVPISEAALKKAKQIYEDSGDIGTWQEE